MAKEYLNDKDFTREIILSKELGELTPTAQKMLTLLPKRIIKKFRYSNPDDEDDCLQTAYLVIFSNWKGFNEQKYDKAFSYFSEIVKRAIARGFNEIYKLKGDPDKKIKTISIQSSNDGEGIYNL